MNSKLCNGIRSFIAAILHQFSVYPLFMMSNIIPFMISYLYQTEKESKGESPLSQDDGYFIHPIMSLCMSIFCFFGGMVEHYLGPKLVILIGGISIALGDFLFTVSKNLILDFFINIFFGIGFGISMTAAVKNATKYFPNKRGLITAIAGGFGGNLGSSIFNLIIKYAVSKGDFPRSEDNNMYQKSTAENFKIFFYIHGCIVLGFSIISSILLVKYKEEKDENDNNIITDEKDKDNKDTDLLGENEEAKKNEKKDENNINYKKGLKQIFKNSKIYLILLIFLFTSFLQGFIFTVGFNYGTMSHGESENTQKISPDQMSIAFMLCSLISSAMGPLFGLIYDKIGFKYTMIIIDLISAINAILINFTVKWGVYFYAISIILNGCINGGAFSMIFPHVSKIYGFHYAGELYGFVVLSTGVSGMISSSIYYIISHFSENKGNNDSVYLVIFIIGAVLNVIAGILVFFDNERKVEDLIKENNNNDPDTANLKLFKTMAENE